MYCGLFVYFGLKRKLHYRITLFGHGIHCIEYVLLTYIQDILYIITQLDAIQRDIVQR